MDDTKHKAAVDFAARLLESPAGPSVGRILLFGSVAQDRARLDSDVDVMVFSAMPFREIQEYTAQAAWEASVEWGEQVAQLTYSLSDLFQPRSYLLYSAINQGQEIYTMNEVDLRRMEADGLCRKADRYLDQAKHAFDRGDYELAIVGAYTAAELVAKALVFMKSDTELPTTHGGMLQIFSREYIRTGQVPEQWGRALNRGLESRSRALYDTSWIMDVPDTQPVIELADEMLSFLEQRLADS
ncbi:MAG: HEPN domain-containing protein [Chloroflexi bacterium]|nr:HEPN domain-containing protein [Chloroflexota bacterium]MBU1661204.1 HEPN domain-containing protein [Chloroflexota bacterium]